MLFSLIFFRFYTPLNSTRSLTNSIFLSCLFIFLSLTNKRTAPFRSSIIAYPQLEANINLIFKDRKNPVLFPCHCFGFWAVAMAAIIGDDLGRTRRFFTSKVNLISGQRAFEGLVDVGMFQIACLAGI